MAVSDYLSLITSEHVDKPNFMAWLAANLQPIQDTMTTADNMIAAFDVDSAIGAQLDIIGRIVGVSRTVNYQPLDGSSPVLIDDSYRILVKAKILKNAWNGTTPGIMSLWKTIFPQFGIQVVDNQDMSMKAVLTGQIDSSTQQLIDNAYIVPKPMGVSLAIEGLTSSSLAPYVGMPISTFDGETVAMVNPSFAGNSTADMSDVTGMIPSTYDKVTVTMQQP